MLYKLNVFTIASVYYEQADLDTGFMTRISVCTHSRKAKRGPP